MIWLGASLAYAALALIAARLLAGHFAWRMHAHDVPYYGEKAEDPSDEQWFGAWAGAICLAPLWPFVVIALLVPWRVGAERQAALDKRERRIREAEKELGL